MNQLAFDLEDKRRCVIRCVSEKLSPWGAPYRWHHAGFPPREAAAVAAKMRVRFGPSVTITVETEEGKRNKE